MSCNCHITNKPNIVIMYTDDSIKNRLDFPVSIFDYWDNRNTYTVHFDSFKVKTQMTTILNVLTDNNVNYEMYLLLNDAYKRPNYIPVSIFKMEATYVVLKEEYDFVADVVSNIFEEMTKGTSIWYVDASFTMPKISQIWYNDPYTTIKWSNGSTTTAKCSENETFSKEVGVAMCISKKYLECRGFEYPRKRFKSIIEKGVDLKGIHDKRDRKKMLKRATELSKAGYSMDYIKKTLNVTDEDILDLFVDE